MQRVTGKTLLGHKLVGFTNLYSQGEVDSSVAITTSKEVMKMTGDHVIKRGHRLTPLMHTDRGEDKGKVLSSSRYTRGLLRPTRN